MNTKIIIAIDGFSSTGKSTIARQLAAHLDYIYVDTGAMYRAITYYALQQQLISEHTFDKQALIKALPQLSISFNLNSNTGIADVYLNTINIESEIRTLDVSNFVSQIATLSAVRKKLVEQQQLMGEDKGLVMDGRDIGTVVFPNAELKVFMTASAATRAKRRYNELLERGNDVNYQEVYNNVVKRDHIDSTRNDSPLLQAKDAVVIDNSDLTIESQLHYILKLAHKKINS